MSSERRTLFSCSLLIATICALTISLYTRLSVTADEPAHFATGMEYLQTGHYLYETQHPPVARVFTAAVPYFLLGERLALTRGMWDEGREFFRDAPSYSKAVTAVKIGVLPFFIMLLAIAALWAQECGARNAGFLAILLCGLNPFLVGHAALATTDAPAAATMLLALFLFQFWLQNGRALAGLALVVAVTIAVGTKFTAVPFLAAGAFGIFLATLLVRGAKIPRPFQWLKLGGIAIAVGPMLLWSIYGFETAKLKNIAPGGVFENLFHDTTFSPAIEKVLSYPLPLGQFIRGLGAVYLHNWYGHQNYFRGEIGATGWWTFFPVMLFYKTPLTLTLLLLLAFGAYILRSNIQPRTSLAPFLAGAFILVGSMFGSINLGTRHILIVYPLLTIFIAAELSRLSSRRWKMVIGLILVLQAVSAARAYPDFIGYFNETAPADRSEIVTDSDLDWGQYNFALQAKLAELHVDTFYSDLFSGTEMDDRFFPHAIPYTEHKEALGWIVIHKECIRLNRPWCLRAAANAPVATVGNSILIYYLDAATQPASPGRSNPGQ